MRPSPNSPKWHIAQGQGEGLEGGNDLVTQNGGMQVRDLSKRIPGIEKLQIIEENSRHGNMEDPLEPGERMYLTH